MKSDRAIGSIMLDRWNRLHDEAALVSGWVDVPLEHCAQWEATMAIRGISGWSEHEEGSVTVRYFFEPSVAHQTRGLARVMGLEYGGPS